MICGVVCFRAEIIDLSIWIMFYKMHWIMVWSSRCFYFKFSFLVPSSAFKNMYVSRSFQSFTRGEPSLFRVFFLCTECFRHFNTDFITKYICMFFYANIPQTPVDSVANIFYCKFFFTLCIRFLKKIVLERVKKKFNT